LTLHLERCGHAPSRHDARQPSRTTPQLERTRDVEHTTAEETNSERTRSARPC